MLELVDIKKDYAVAGEAVHALKGVSVKFRDSEFVSILGASGCGKTTLLNIIGGLDHYTSGDLIIEGKSTKEYKDGDWDTYRNHSIGFIFQSYHLIPHQTVLQNVELALTISGVPKKERRQRAIEALEKVGLGDKIHNKPNQLSGGQAQRVAIARALINDPEIVLADEPTGALDSKTSVQIMELLKEISKDRLVIMVTHNPELAEKYSTRIIRLLDGLITDDNMPYDGKDKEAEGSGKADGANAAESAESAKDGQPKASGKGKKASMSIGMAFGLSLKNLLSKRRRTAMVSVAGSIGIIGVSMVLAISAGVQGYIGTMENDMLSGNPVSITQSAYDFTSLMEISDHNLNVDIKELAQGNKIYVESLLDTLGTLAKGFEKTNNITEEYVDYVSKLPEESVNVVQYDYAFNIINNLYTDFTVSRDLQSHLKPGESAEGKYNGGDMSVTAIRAMYASVLSHVEEYKQWGSMIGSVRTFDEVPDNYDYIMSQYDVLAVDKDGKAVTEGYTDEELKAMFEAKDTLVMVVTDYQFNDLMLAEFGYFTEDEFLDYAFKGVGRKEDVTLVGSDGFPYSFFVGDTAKKFTYYPNDCVYSAQKFTTKPQLSNDSIMTLVPPYLMRADSSITEQQAMYVASQIVTERAKGNDALREFLQKPRQQGGLGLQGEQFDQIYNLVKMPDEPETTGYVANAYTTAHDVTEGDDDLHLPAMEENSEGYEKRVELGVKMILQKKEDVSYGCLDTGLYYTHALTEYILDTEEESEIVEFLNENGAVDEIPLYIDYYYVDEGEEGPDDDCYVLGTERSVIDTGATVMSAIIGGVSGAGAGASSIDAKYLGGSRVPIAVYLYPVDFNQKDFITDYLDAWNDMCEKGESYTYTGFDGAEHTVKLEVKDKITYTDTVGLIIGMINTMIQMVTIALVAFTALSLVVSTVMIGIITYVSVVERIKEIGILRAVGARKKDIKRLFNAETFIIGLAAGVFGILVTYLLSLVINVIVVALAGVWGIAALPWWQAAIMILISVCLTLISGLIPASAAAKKDPVVALRTE